MDEYYTVEVISMPPDPPGVGPEPGPPRGIERGGGVPPRPVAHRLVEQRGRVARTRLCPRPGHRAGDAPGHVDVDLGGAPGGERAVIERDPDRGPRALREVGAEIGPRLLLGAVELRRHLLQRRAELVREEVELGRRLDLVDVDHTFRGLIRSQKVQAYMSTVPPLKEARRPKVWIASFCGMVGGASAPRPAAGPI